MPKLNALVAGSTGYIGVQLIKLLIKHKFINIKYLCGNSSVGKNISSYDKSLYVKKLPKIIKFNNSNKDLEKKCKICSSEFIEENIVFNKSNLYVHYNCLFDILNT